MSAFKKGDETAADWYRRSKNLNFLWEIIGKQTGLLSYNVMKETIFFGETYEVYCSSRGNITLNVLEVMKQYAHSHPDGLIIHISTDDNLYKSLYESNIEIPPSLLELEMHKRFKCCVVKNIVHLINLIKMLSKSLNGMKAMVIFEGLNPVVFCQRTFDSTYNVIAYDLLKALNTLKESQQVIGLWFTVVASKEPYSIRDISSKGSFQTQWKVQLNRIININNAFL